MIGASSARSTLLLLGPAFSAAWLFGAPGFALAQEVARVAASDMVEILPADLEAADWASLRAAYEAARHQAVLAPEGFRARNPGQLWTTSFDGRGFTTQPDSGAWSWGLELVSYGFPGAELSVQGRAAETCADGQRVTYRWEAGLDEWYQNDRRGLEHGYTVHERPRGGGAARGLLTFELAVRGDLRAKISADGRDALFVNEEGATVLSYAGLIVLDADGESLPARLEAADEGLWILVDDDGARYPLLIDPVAQEAYLKASNRDIGDLFGSAVAAFGDRIVIGAPRESSAATGVNGNQADNSAVRAGAAYVFVRGAAGWSQEAYLKASNTTAEDFFGHSVAFSGDTIVVGAVGEDSSATGVNGNQNSSGAPASGAVYVFVRNGASWSQQAYIKASNTAPLAGFGFSVAISGDTLVVGSPYEASAATGVNGNQNDQSASRAGAAYVFVRDGAGTWSQQAYLKASNAEAHDFFGEVAIAGDTLVVGAQFEQSASGGVNGDQANNSLVGAGAAYVFTRQGTSWSQEAYLKPNDPRQNGLFGHSVAVSGDTVAVGAYVNQGAAYVFARSGGSWNLEARLPKPTPLSGFGYPVVLEGDVLVVGAPRDLSSSSGVNGDHLDTTTHSAGAAFVYARSGAIWNQQAYLKASNPSKASEFGVALAISGESLIVGSLGEDGGSFGVNGDQSDQSTVNSGAAYVFDLGAPEPAVAFCFGVPAACPCANPGFAGHGCSNSQGPAGGRLDATGSTSIAASSLIFIGSHLAPGKLGLYLEGDIQAGGGAGSSFGDGLRCVSGNQVRIQLRVSNVLGSSSTNLLLPSRVGAIAGSTRYYQLLYRDAGIGACGSGFNGTNGLEVVWAP